jgi:hypothetical protein
VWRAPQEGGSSGDELDGIKYAMCGRDADSGSQSMNTVLKLRVRFY